MIVADRHAFVPWLARSWPGAGCRALWLAGHHAAGQAHVRGLADQQADECLELLALLFRLRLVQGGELGPDEDQVVTLDDGLFDAGSLGQVTGRALRGV